MIRRGTTKRWQRAAAAVAALALVAGACGGDDDSGDDDGDDTEQGDDGDDSADDSGDDGDDSGDDGDDDDVDAVQGGSILESVQAAGVLKCGVSGAATGFSVTEADGSVTGLDADYCRAVAAAVTGSADSLEFTILTAAERFTAVQTGDIDVLMRNSTWTQSRDTDVGMDFGPTTYFDGQQLMAREGDGFSSSSEVAEIDGAIVCTNAGTTTETNIAALAGELGIEITLNTFEDFDQVVDGFIQGTCDIITTDGGVLVGRKSSQQPDDENWVIFPAAPISKEPLGPVYAQNDSQWADVINWVTFAILIADEYGVTSGDVDAALAGDFGAEMQRLMGGEGELQSAMGLAPEAFYNVISQVGNYQEIWDANLTPVGLVREGSNNAQWTDGGLMYAPPAR